MVTQLDIRIEVPTTTSADSLLLARSRAREAAVVSLQQSGELTVREAARELGLSYEGYLDLLHHCGLSISPVDASSDLAAVRGILQLRPSNEISGQAEQ